MLDKAALAAAVVGLAASIAGYIEYRRALQGGSLICRADGKPGGCASVYVIPQAVIAGRVHLSELAPLYFTALTIAALLYVVAGNPWPLLLLSAGGALAVPYLVYLEVRVARAICMWCTIMHLSIITTLALAAAAALSGLGASL